MLGGGILIGTAIWAVNDARQVALIRELEAEKAELQRIVGRLKTDRRVARLLVAGQDRDPQGRITQSHLEFKELAGDGGTLVAQSFDVPGDFVYVDALVVRFTDEYVERGDALRGHSLHLFRRVFGENQPPSEGPVLDRAGTIPAAYRTRANPGAFEEKLWGLFWEYASNPEAAAKAGVRVAQGEAVYQRVRAGQLWQLATRADGGLEFKLERLDPMIEAHLSRQR